ncbi:pyridoxamine 5'-phosphate oxidase family protein [Silanimonas lenta]|uniref:pyridoxamine 5'-phosphate oxidase family protein n=1 Tax=Silanimonas lenta TaxID=265429 RepID=UPI000412932B|nr:pyridoxamine 5'-phosphate oxidase family protein [Silanimonas lenta]
MDSRDLPEPSLPGVLDRCWALLAEGQRLRHSPFHQGVLGTLSRRGPATRYVVLRQVDREQGVLGFHTDRRSEKWGEIERDPRVSLCFFGQGQQIRAEGLARRHAGDAPAELAWKRTGLMSRRCYLATPGPGTVLPGPGSGLPAPLATRRPEEAESAAGWVHFGLVQVVLARLEWLNLAFEGHRRARFVREGGRWRGEWCVP